MLLISEVMDVCTRIKAFQDARSVWKHAADK